MSHKKITKEEFIERANKIHNNKYLYDKVIINSTRHNITVTCPIHGDFEVYVMRHLQGYNCSKCNSESKRLTQEQFIEKAHKTHNNKFSYEKTEYQNSRKNVIVICPKHGEFSVQANNHIRGNGCKKCSQEEVGFNKRLSSEDWIKRAKEVHGVRFDYSDTKYIHNRERLKIYCREHRISFEQLPDNHINGVGGCPKCDISKGELAVGGFLNQNNISNESQKMFPDCKHKYVLRFDFYLPDFNMCIEFDGIQHFKPVEHFGGSEIFEQTKIRDRIKVQYCSKNNIKLLRIPFSEINNIDKILTKALKL
jgi:hypothetical protein